jgi:hypothetical protein
VLIWYIFSGFGIVHHEESGNIFSEWRRQRQEEFAVVERGKKLDTPIVQVNTLNVDQGSML